MYLGWNLVGIYILLSFLQVDLGDTLGSVQKLLIWAGMRLAFSGHMTAKFKPAGDKKWAL